MTLDSIEPPLSTYLTKTLKTALTIGNDMILEQIIYNTDNYISYCPTSPIANH